MEKVNILGYSTSLGVYKLLDNGKISKQFGNIEKYEMERDGTEAVLRFSLISRHLRWLQGEILTILEASIDDERKLKAVKDLVKNQISAKISWLYEQCGCPENEQDFLEENNGGQNPDPTIPMNNEE